MTISQMTICQLAVCLTITHQKVYQMTAKWQCAKWQCAKWQFSKQQYAKWQSTIWLWVIWHSAEQQLVKWQSAKWFKWYKVSKRAGFLVFEDLSFGTKSSTCWGAKTLIFMAECHSAGCRLADCRGTIETLADQKPFPNVDKVSMFKRFDDFWSKSIWPTDNWSTP